jgi:hypothetical protein
LLKKDKEDENYDFQKKSIKLFYQLKQIYNNLTCRFVTYGGAFRAFANTIVSCYLPVYF